MNDQDYLAARLSDLAAKTWRQDILTHTNFLTAAEQAFLKDLQRGALSDRRLDPVPVTLWGGFEEAERQCAVFLPSYLSEESVPGEIVTCLRCRPLQARFADELTHRDFLGALMNLGIEREMVGDILIDSSKSEAYIFVMTPLAETVAKELTRVRHTSVAVGEVPFETCAVRPAFEERDGFISSERLDAVAALVYRLSRSKAHKLIADEAVSVDGRLISNAGYVIRAGAKVTVRGFGKFIYDGADGHSKKGRLHAHVRVYK